MWPFRPRVEAPAADGPRPVPAPVIRRDWAGLPPIQRFVGAHPLTAPSDQFSDDLATHQDPSVTTDTMGHQVSAEAPAGLVLAIARPTTRSDGPAMIPRPRVQRSVAGAVAESGEWDGDAAASDLTRPIPLPMSAAAVATRELPVVAPQPAVQRLTSLPPNAQPTPVPPVAQRSRAVPMPLNMFSPSDESSETQPAPRLTLGQSRRLGLGPPIKQVPDHSVQRASSDSMPEAEASPPLGSVPTFPHMGTESIDLSQAETAATGPMQLDRAPGPNETRASTPGAPRASSLHASDEPRLDLPLAPRPAADEPSTWDPLAAPLALPVQPSATSSTGLANDPWMGTLPAVQRVGLGGSPAPSSTKTPHTLNLANAPMASLPGVSTSRLPLTTESPTRVPASFAASAPGTAPFAPLVGARPLRPFADVQRSASTMTLARMATEDPPGLTLPEMGTEDATTLTLPQRVREEVTLPRMGREAQPPRMAREERSLPLAPSRGFAVQRASVVSDASGTEPTESAIDTDAPMVQGSWFDSISAGVSGMTSGASTSGASLGGSAVGSAIGSVASSLGSHKAEETDMDELAGKLYDRIRSRLKTELLIDRERAGFLTDLR